MKNILFFACTLFAVVACKPKESTNKEVEGAAVPYIKGESKLMIDPKPSPDFDDNRWFTNDHCFIEKDGVLHWFGINNPYPPQGKDLYRYHPYLGHCTTSGTIEEWKREPFAIDESKGTEYVGAPFVVWHQESQRYAMVVEVWHETRRLQVYWSDDLYDWKPQEGYILPETLWIGTRDPHIMKGTDGKYWIHVVGTGNKGVKQTQVIRIKTKDFVNFEEPETILGIDDCTWATLIESPFLLERNGLWYLFFTYAHRRYAETLVVVSDNPDHFKYEKNTITTLFGHAAEIFEYKGKTYITSCGPEDQHYLNSHGITVAELGWTK
ncbi:hypothetical protein [Carboxylicivirga taeanensis]|uniref:hypothetical protein n=1 Tax=Carboxylicivirga taeanensis TaxID=1416875 RepID=UPI003F6DCCD3